MKPQKSNSSNFTPTPNNCILIISYTFPFFNFFYKFILAFILMFLLIKCQLYTQRAKFTQGLDGLCVSLTGTKWSI